MWLQKMAGIASSSVLLLACSQEGSPVASQEFDIQSNPGAARVVVKAESCVDLLAGQTIQAGSVCVSIQGNDLAVTYKTDSGWTIKEAHLWAGLSLAQMPQTNNGNPKIGNFPHHSGALSGAASYSFSVPLSVFGLDSGMTSCNDVNALVVAHAVVSRITPSGAVQTETAYGEGTRLVQKGNWATWFSASLGCEKDTPPVVGACETSFAYGNSYATCFNNITSTPRWGWSNGPIPEGSYTFDIYAGAGQCDLSKGQLVGSMQIEYASGTLSATYSTLPGFIMSETHFYAGSDPLPSKNGEYTVAPGQYGNIHELDLSSEDTFTISGLSGSVNVVAHAVTCALE